MPPKTYESPQARELDWTGLLETALTMPGSTGNTYSRFHEYSLGNRALFYMQGIEPQPVATYNRWKEVGRHVVRGARAKEVLRPITVKAKNELDEEGNPKQFTRFKLVRAIFALCDTEGPELPPLETPDWTLDQAMAGVNVEREPFRLYDGNTQGYSYGRKLAISEVAVDPLATAVHELGHIVLGHTVGERMQEYATHRGQMEFEAESTAYLTLNEIEALSDERASSSRAYIQGWLRGEKPSDKSIRGVFSATDQIVRAGRALQQPSAA